MSPHTSNELYGKFLHVYLIGYRGSATLYIMGYIGNFHIHPISHMGSASTCISGAIWEASIHPSTTASTQRLHTPFTAYIGCPHTPCTAHTRCPRAPSHPVLAVPWAGGRTRGAPREFPRG